MAADSPRIPAWKKLGLKLKNAREDVPAENGIACSKDHAVNAPLTPAKKAEKRPPQAEDSASPAKKLRLESPQPGDNKQPETNGRKTPKKSVAFAADTKSTDGPLEPAQELEDDTETRSTDKRKAAKKEKKPKKQKQVENGSTSPTQPSEQKPPIATSSAPTDPLLEYLSVYHRSRSQWKFHKNRETQLFKHILSLERIPTSYTAALASYLAGLKGESAKKRLATAAKEAIEVDQAEVAGKDEDVRARGAYNDAISSYRGQLVERKKDPDHWTDNDGTEPSNFDETWSQMLDRRKRAELVLALVGDVVRAQGKADDKRHEPTQKETAQKKKRKTKLRTTSVEDESSSDSTSSSESQSESDSDTSSSSDIESSSDSDSDSNTSSSSDSSSDSDSE